MKVRELLKRLLMRFEEEGIELYCEAPSPWEYFSVSTVGGEGEIEEGERIMCYITPGGSEGYYFHVDRMGKERKLETILLGKFFELNEKNMKILEIVTFALDWSHPQKSIFY